MANLLEIKQLKWHFKFSQEALVMLVDVTTLWEDFKMQIQLNKYDLDRHTPLNKRSKSWKCIPEPKPNPIWTSISSHENIWNLHIALNIFFQTVRNREADTVCSYHSGFWQCVAVLKNIAILHVHEHKNSLCEKRITFTCRSLRYTGLNPSPEWCRAESVRCISLTWSANSCSHTNDNHHVNFKFQLFKK